MTLRARLVVLADGGRSALLGLVGGRVGSQIGEQTAGRVNEQTGDQTGGQIGEQTGEQIDGQTGDHIGSQTNRQTSSQTTEQVGGQVDGQVNKQTANQTGNHGDKTTGQVDGQTANQTGDQTAGQLSGQTGEQVGDQTTKQVNGPTGDQIGEQTAGQVDGQTSTQPPEHPGIHPSQRAYPHSAIITIVHTDRAHHGRAYERFTREGPLALLPHSAGRYALVWSSDARRVAARMALSDAAFVRALQAAFGDRAGNFSQPTPRKCYPLRHATVDTPVGRRTVAIGNAAHTVHPVAGQGFNLGLGDVAALAEILQRAAGQQRDIGSPAVLAEYAALRRRETAMVSGFTDGLIRLFGSRRTAVRLARNLALAGIELFPPAKRLLLRRTTGMAAKRSRLGAGCSW